MSRVAIVKENNPVHATVTGLEMIADDVDKVLGEGKPILIKPNYLNSKSPSTGVTTDGRVVEGVVKFLKMRKVENLVIGEGSGWADTYHAFKVAGLDAVAKKWRVPLVDRKSRRV